LWQYGNHPEEVYSNKFMWTKLDYIHLNPVRAGIVEKASLCLFQCHLCFRFRIVENRKSRYSIVDVMNLNNFTKYNKY
jgi:hypothetical protein